MEVGVLDLYPEGIGAWHLIKSIFDLGYTPVVLHMYSIIKNKQSLAKLIGNSGITKWVFSGSPQWVHNKGSSQIPLNALHFKDKEFLLICYSMESVIKQLGHNVLQRYENKKEFFNLHVQKTKVIIHDKEFLFKNIKNPLYAWRNHKGYTPAEKYSDIVELASYRGELMIGFYKNLLFTQFHPERSADGKKLLRNWLENPVNRF